MTVLILNSQFLTLHTLTDQRKLRDIGKIIKNEKHFLAEMLSHKGHKISFAHFLPLQICLLTNTNTSGFWRYFSDRPIQAWRGAGEEMEVILP